MRLDEPRAALGHAAALFEGALQYTQARVQFGKPLAAQQTVQERLSQMLEAITSMQLQAAAVARVADPAFSPITMSPTPESRRFSAWVRPWLP